MLKPAISQLPGAAIASTSPRIGGARVRRTVAALGLFSMLGACTQDVLLQAGDVPEIVRGRLTINLKPPHFIDLVLEGHPYHGEWHSVPKSLSAISASAPDKTSREYQRIASGLDPAPVVEVSAILVSRDAPPLKCEWIRRHGDVDGSCLLPDGRVWRLKAS